MHKEITTQTNIGIHDHHTFHPISTSIAVPHVPSMDFCRPEFQHPAILNDCAGLGNDGVRYGQPETMKGVCNVCAHACQNCALNEKNILPEMPIANEQLQGKCSLARTKPTF